MNRFFLIGVAALVTACAKTEAQAEGAAAPAAAMNAAAAFSPPVAPARSLPPGAVILQRSAIMDPGVMGKGPAFYVMLPQGWAGEGGVELYGARPCGEIFGVNWSAASPDGNASVAIFPNETWQGGNFGAAGDCRPGNFANARDYLADRAARMFQGAQVLDYRPRPDYAKAAEERAAITRAAAAAVGNTGITAWADGGEVLFAFTRNGAEMRGVIGASMVFYGSEHASPMGGEPLRTLTGATLGTFGAFAPAGKLDFTLIEAVRKSVTPDPRWLEAYFDFEAKMSQVQIDATKQRAAMIIAGGAEATRQNIATFKAMASASVQASRDSVELQTRRPPDAVGSREIFPGDLSGDRMQRESIEGIRGVETYADPIAGGNVQLDATYDHAWRINNNDAYILTNDPNFNPGQYGIEATQMGVVQ